VTDDLLKRLREPVDDLFFGKIVEPIKCEAAGRIEHMKSLMVRLFEFLDLTEESDSGNIFHPITIGSCRADKQQPLEDLLAEMKKASM
jgi:hypothetical protein